MFSDLFSLSIYATSCPSALRGRRVMGEDIVASFVRLVTSESGFEQRRVRIRFAILKLSEPPAARCGVFS